jgi:hypothetical protein
MVGISVGMRVAVGVAAGVSVRRGMRAAVGVAAGVASEVKFAPVVLAPAIVIFAGVVPISTFAVVSFKPPTNVLDAN